MLNISRRIALLSREYDWLLVSGNGSRIDLFDIRTDEIVRSIDVMNDGEDIYKLVEGQEGIFAMGERNVKHIPDENLYEPKMDKKKELSLTFEENLLDMTFFEDPKQLVVVSRSLTVWVEYFDWWTVTSKSLYCSCPDKIAMFTASVIMGNNWQTLTIVAGTSLGEITVFKPASKVTHTCAGPAGMIFSMCRFERYLYCVSDDRSLSVYDCAALLSADEKDSDDELSLVKLSQEYGHSCRPFAVCTDEDGKIYTGGQDAVLIQWQYSDDKGLKLLRKREINHGVIRSICDIGPSIFVGHEAGSLVRVFLKLMESDTVLSWGKEECVKSFVRLSNGEFDVLRYSDEKIRFISRIPFDTPLSEYVVLVGEKSITVRRNNSEVLWRQSFDSEVTDAFVFETLAFIFTDSNEGFIFGLQSHITHAQLSFANVFEQLNIKTRLKFTSFSYSVVKGIKGTRRVVVVVGTTTGQVFYGSFENEGSMVEMTTSRELNAAFKKGPVNQLLCLEGDLHALGRNGVLALCNLRPNGEIAVISARPLCPWIKGFTPCGFDEERELIFGFRGKTFMVVSYSDHQILDSFDCGGPNRQWYFTTHLPVRDLPYSSYYFFDFLSKGKIITAHLHAKVMTILALPANTARIIGATNINTHEVYSTLATIGADHSVTIFRIYGASQERDLNLVLYNEAMPTSVCSTVVLTGEYLIFVGGEKGSITTWLINPVDLITLDPRHVISNEYKRGDSSARVTSVSAGRNASRKDLPDLEHFVAAAYADGVIEILKVVFANDKLGVSLELFRRIDRNPDFSVPTKIDIYRRRSPDIAPVSELEVHAVSTSGKRAFHYTLSWDHPEIRRRMANDYFRVEKCGLSALYVAKAITTRSEGDMLIIGSESGRITVIYSPVEGLPKRYAIGKYHSATVTGLFAFHSEGNSYVGSVALDCRFALWEYNGSKPKGMELIKAIALDVRDPSELVLVNFGALIVGDGMQFIDLEPYLLLGKTSSSRSSF